MDTARLTAAEIQQQLEKRTTSLSARIASIKQEFAPLVEISGDGMPLDEIDSSLSTEQKVGIALGATLVLGLAIGLRARKKKLSRAERAGASVRLYVDHLLDEAAKLAAEGKDVDEALRKVLSRKPAVVQVETLDLPEEKSLLSGAVGSLAGLIMPILAKEVTNWVSQQLGSKDREPTE